MAILINKKRLHEFMKFRRWNKTDLAKSMDFSEAYITLLLNGEREISSNVMEKLVKITGLSFDELFFCPEVCQNVHKRGGICTL